MGWCLVKIALWTRVFFELMKLIIDWWTTLAVDHKASSHHFSLGIKYLQENLPINPVFCRIEFPNHGRHFGRSNRILPRLRTRLINRIWIFIWTAWVTCVYLICDKVVVGVRVKVGIFGFFKSLDGLFFFHFSLVQSKFVFVKPFYQLRLVRF